MSLLITKAGIAASIRAGELGISYKISEISIGTEGYIPSAEQTSLRREILRKRITAGDVVSLGRLHFETLWDGPEEFEGKELGYWLDDGTLFAIDSRDGEVITYKRKDTVVTEACELNLVASTINNITVEMLGTPRATEERAGIAKIATHESTTAGLDDETFITPAKLAPEVERAAHSLGGVRSLGLISYAPQVITSNETIPDNVNATIIGPRIEVASGVKVTIGRNSVLTVR